MPVLPFSAWLDAEGLSFGLGPAHLDAIRERSQRGESAGALLDDEALQRAGLHPDHLLRIRRAVLRHAALCEAARGLDAPEPIRNALQAATWRWARREAPGDRVRQAELAGVLASLASAALERGRLRMHLKRAGDPRSEQVADLAERTEGCDEIPAHRWFAAARAVADGLLWIEVLPPEGELKGAGAGLADRLAHGLAKPVLDRIAERAERSAIASAATALSSLLSTPPIQAAVAGLLVDARCIRVALPESDEDSEFGLRDLESLAAWLAARDVKWAGLSRLNSAPMAGLVEALSAQGVSVEMVREAGLMKQARKACQGQKHSPHLKLAAARVVAGRLRDPLSGYAGLEPDELGLGEYLDRVDASRLHAALADARDVAVWQREHGRAQGPAARGVAANPMVRKLADIVPGMELVGVVANLTGFGAFVDVGLESQGLVHVSEMSDETFVSHPSEVLQVGQRVRVRVLELDMARERLSLSMRGARNETRRKGRERRLQSLRALDELFKK